MRQTHSDVSPKCSPISVLQHETQRLQLRWFFAIIMTTWTFAAIAAPIIAFCITMSPFSFSLFSTLAPPVYLWYRFAKYVFMDERLFELEKMKIQTKVQNTKKLC